MVLYRGTIGRCPNCGMGHLFRTFYQRIEGCAQCGRRFEGTGNQNTGAIGISMTTTTALGFAGGILLVLYAPALVAWGVLVLCLGLIAIHALLYRLSYGLWIGILVLTGAFNEDDQRDEFFL